MSHQQKRGFLYWLFFQSPAEKRPPRPPLALLPNHMEESPQDDKPPGFNSDAETMQSAHQDHGTGFSDHIDTEHEAPQNFSDNPGFPAEFDTTHEAYQNHTSNPDISQELHENDAPPPVPSLPPGKWIKLAIRSEKVQTVVELTSFPVEIGSVQSSIKFNDKGISPRHAVMDLHTDMLSIIDTHSQNGVYIGDNLIEPGVVYPVFPGDAITVGSTEIIVIDYSRNSEETETESADYEPTNQKPIEPDEQINQPDAPTIDETEEVHDIAPVIPDAQDTHATEAYGTSEQTMDMTSVWFAQPIPDDITSADDGSSAPPIDTISTVGAPTAHPADTISAAVTSPPDPVNITSSIKKLLDEPNISLFRDVLELGEPEDNDPEPDVRSLTSEDTNETLPEPEVAKEPEPTEESEDMAEPVQPEPKKAPSTPVLALTAEEFIDALVDDSPRSGLLPELALAEQLASMDIETPPPPHAEEPAKQTVPPPRPPKENSKVCGNCETTNEAKDKFCGKCGTQLKAPPPAIKAFCGQCGAKNVHLTKFCGDCGFLLATSSENIV